MSVRVDGIVLSLVAGLASATCASPHPPTPHPIAPRPVARHPTEPGRVLVASPPARARSHSPTPATQVQRVALEAETTAARAHPRPGTASLFDAANLSPVAFRTSDGLAGWRITIGAGRPLATPAIANGTVYIGGGFGSHEFYAFDAVTGASRWAVRVSDDGPTAAVVDDGKVAFNTESCTLFVVDAQTGRMAWSRWLGDPLMSQPAIANGHVYMAFPGGGAHRLVAFELATGAELWRVPIASDIISAPVVYGDSVYTATFDGTVYRHRASDGGLAWQEAYHATSAPWLYGDQVLVSHREDPAHAMLASRMFFAQQSTTSTPVESVGRVNASTGAGSQTEWAPRSAPWLDPEVQRRSNYHTSQHASDTSVGFSATPAAAQAGAAMANIGQGTVQGMWEYQGSRPSVIDGRMFLTQGDRLVAMDPDSGHELWSVALQGVLATAGGHLASPPSAAGGNLYLAGVTGDIVIVAQTDGHVVHTIHLGTSMRFQPAIVGGRLFVGTSSGDVISLDLGDAHADGWAMWGGSAGHNGG